MLPFASRHGREPSTGYRISAPFRNWSCIPFDPAETISASDKQRLPGHRIHRVIVDELARARRCVSTECGRFQRGEHLPKLLLFSNHGVNGEQHANGQEDQKPESHRRIPRKERKADPTAILPLRPGAYPSPGSTRQQEAAQATQPRGRDNHWLHRSGQTESTESPE